ncbi:hypothetical protein ZIOFF_069698 [Zingiber officinale]|uniref:Uncharacterized protein n=1 Tax=Zingiber officinale TaxID=94328 RepID=A0A8J5CE00_ZINOF|nr:hypothetical protein ZIOFF_069698 [Zingiber officinale]
MLLSSRAPNGGLTAAARRCSSSKPHPSLFSDSRRRFPSWNPRRPPTFYLSAPAGPIPRRLHSPTASIQEEEAVSVGDDGVPFEGVIQFEKPESSSKLLTWGKVGLLVGGDLLCILVFSAVGRFSHGLPVLDLETLRTSDPFVAGWVLSAYFFGAYGDDGRGVNGLNKAVIAAVKSWAIGIPVGIAIRSGTSGHIPPIAFILVAMGTTGILLIAWRALISNLLSGNQSKKNDAYKQGSPFELFEVVKRVFPFDLLRVLAWFSFTISFLQILMYL